ncbi:hydrogenase expression/formation protein HypD [Desulfitobacterium dichloroeliminans LMG P-21439]|uniref:Hydrogenase expression/formation protein HypD n=1 Tax=Desulfitobacterium dichloroeliminans (strain LMG P-21439 / DCA1) TaxID=871963 RepID=L0FAA0_DESDL|nr:hydrogenase formation protein HypD [Desulfitobacterium dichloroeliminans]AGA69955.1 hydrogenase expression/formation protein HypD [Desulfitobacterium dichloroeliminans LMG P-21439]
MPVKNYNIEQGIKTAAERYLQEIYELATTPYTVMEVCGTHTVAIAKNALRDILPSQIRLVSGPGCPVCVTDSSDIDRFLYLAAQPNVITATFGDMIRVPGSKKSLQMLRGEGADIRIVYSTLDALELARKNPTKEVVFLGVGFETTVPTVAVSIESAKNEGLKNYSVLSMHKLVPPVLRALAEDPETKVDGFLDPGHVCAIIGTKPIEFMAKDYNKPGVVTGFEGVDVLEGLVMLLRQRAQGRSEIEIQYQRMVKPEGNPVAQSFIDKVFEPVDAAFRGLGTIEQGGLGIRKGYEDWDAEKKFDLPVFETVEIPGCRCGQVLKGQIAPPQCPLFGRKCTPLAPVGPCMVSSEGSCAAYYRYAQRSEL